MTARLGVLPSGPTAAVLEVADTAAAAALAAHLRQLDAADAIQIDEIVPAARTVLVQCRSAHTLAAVVDRAEAFDPVSTSLAAGPIVDIEVRYDGPDLADVAASTGFSIDEVVRRHRSATYLGAFSGFAPGFTYLVGLDPALHLPRRSTPRPRIAAGSVAIGGEFAGVYPTASPGGWHLLGSTDVTLWDIGRSQPALIPPGSRVRFVDRGRRGTG